ncbi:MAG TPA: BREX system ATP-binding domain-containing protein, partial [Actinomycetota bacterium]|nr:BREX system ATP-binding domain-containing protein [Actinomycetota bacterium]
MRPVVCPVVVGRDEELAVLDGELSRARDGAGGVAFLVGEAGIGKSRLAREAGARATAAGMVVLRGRAVQGGAPVPFRPLAEALHSGLRDRTHDDPALAPYRPALGQLVADGAGASHQQASPLVLLEAVVRLLRSLAGHRGLLLVLEDLHWADADTLSVVEYLADNLASEAALCLGTVRSDEPSSAGTLVDALAGRRAAAAIALRRLPPAEVAEMVAACAPEAELTAVGREVLERRAEGVPFLVEELLSAALARDGGPVSERLERAVPVSYRELVRSRLARVPAEARRTVQAAAVLGRGFDWTLLPEIAGLDPRDVLGALRAAVDAQLVSAGDDETFEFRHALLRESILAELLPPERRELALRAADVIQATRPGLPGELCELAADLRERGGDRDGAFRLLLEAGRRALARAALATAEITAERARSLGEGDPWSEMGADLLLAEILSLAGKVDRLREVGAEVLETAAQHPFSMGSPARQASVHLRIAQGIADAGDPEAAEPHVQRAAALAGADETAAIRLEALRARLAMARGDPEGAASSAARALNAAERAGLRDAACRALLVLARAALERG